MLASETNSKTLCPACRQPGLDSFYRVDAVPVNSCLLMSTSHEAKVFPKADLELAVCLACGFITNICFDSVQVTYAPEYEDQQSFSPTFNDFAKQLAGRLVEDFGLHEKDIVEIGCGKGDFLKLLCAIGNNRGTGIDPSITPRQIGPGTETKIRWIPEFLKSSHHSFPADFYCCRHTLEHIHDVQTFIRLMRQIIGDRPAPVFLEVPDTERVLTTSAFEDIYHEHCSYFTGGSLAHLMRASDFGVTRLYREYADQYLMIEAIPSARAVDAPLALEIDTEQTLGLIARFRDDVADKKHYWAEVFQQYRERPIALWGSGSKCVSLLSSLKPATENITVVDINPHRHGKFMPGSGLEIRAPEILRESQPQLIIAMNSIYMTEIQSVLDDLSVSGQLLGL
jgi:hypothetical protein